MPEWKLAAPNQVQDVVAHAEQFKTFANSFSAHAAALGNVSRGITELKLALPISAGFVYGVKVFAADVFDEHDIGGLLVGQLPDNAGYFIPMEDGSNGPETALAGDDLMKGKDNSWRLTWTAIAKHLFGEVLAARALTANAPDGDRLGQAIGFDRCGQFLKFDRVEDSTVVMSWRNLAGGDVLDGVNLGLFSHGCS